MKFGEKRKLSTVVATASLLCSTFLSTISLVSPIPVQADEANVDLSAWQIKEETDTKILTNYTGNAKDVVIPLSGDLGTTNVKITKTALREAATSADKQGGTLTNSMNDTSGTGLVADNSTDDNPNDDVVDYSGTFKDLKQITKIDLSELKIEALDGAKGKDVTASDRQEVQGEDGENGESINVSSMFENCISLKEVNLSSFTGHAGNGGNGGNGYGGNGGNGYGGNGGFAGIFNAKDMFVRTYQLSKITMNSFIGNGGSIGNGGDGYGGDGYGGDGYGGDGGDGFGGYGKIIGNGYGGDGSDLYVNYGPDIFNRFGHYFSGGNGGSGYGNEAYGGDSGTCIINFDENVDDVSDEIIVKGGNGGDSWSFGNISSGGKAQSGNGSDGIIKFGENVDIDGVSDKIIVKGGEGGSACFLKEGDPLTDEGDRYYANFNFVDGSKGTSNGNIGSGGIGVSAKTNFSGDLDMALFCYMVTLNKKPDCNDMRIREYSSYTGTVEKTDMFYPIAVKECALTQKVGFDVNELKANVSALRTVTDSGKGENKLNDTELAKVTITATDQSGNAVDLANVSKKSGKYNLTYTYGGKTVPVTLTVEGAIKIETKDLTIGTGDTWNPKDNLVRAIDSDGNPLTIDQLTVTRADKVNVNQVGSYTITYEYQGVKQTAKVNVIDIQTKKIPTLDIGETFNPYAGLASVTEANGSNHTDETWFTENVEVKVVPKGTTSPVEATTVTQTSGVYTITYTYQGVSRSVDVTVEKKELVDQPKIPTTESTTDSKEIMGKTGTSRETDAKSEKKNEILANSAQTKTTPNDNNNKASTSKEVKMSKTSYPKTGESVFQTLFISGIGVLLLISCFIYIVYTRKKDNK